MSKNGKLRKKLFQNLSPVIGMSPYNAAVSAGYGHRVSKKIAELRIMRRFLEVRIEDIAEQEGITPRTIIRHLKERAGIGDREAGAKKIVGILPVFGKIKEMISTSPEMDTVIDEAMKAYDFVEVPDDKTQLDYLRTLLEYIGATKKSLTEGDDGPPRFNIQINVVKNGEIKKADIVDIVPQEIDD